MRRETTRFVFIATGRQYSTETIWLGFFLSGGECGETKIQTINESNERVMKQ